AVAFRTEPTPIPRFLDNSPNGMVRELWKISKLPVGAHKVEAESLMADPQIRSVMVQTDDPSTGKLDLPRSIGVMQIVSQVDFGKALPRSPQPKIALGIRGNATDDIHGNSLGQLLIGQYVELYVIGIEIIGPGAIGSQPEHP